MATNLVDRAWMNVSGTPGTGNITLGSVVAGNQSFSDAGVTDGTPIPYVVFDGNDWEEGIGQSSSSVTVWQRTTVSRSVISGTAGTTKLTLSSSAQVFLTARAVDLADASLLKTGTVGTARLGSGTASSSTFLRGDQSWAAVVSTGRLIGYNKYSSSQTITIPTGATSCFVRMTGGGGGSDSNSGGAGAGSLEKYLTGITAGSTLAFTAGAAGSSGGSGGNSVLASGTQSISTLTCNGGTVFGGPNTGNGSTATGGDNNVTGGSAVVSSTTALNTYIGGMNGLSMGQGASRNGSNVVMTAATAGYAEIWWFS